MQRQYAPPPPAAAKSYNPGGGSWKPANVQQVSPEDFGVKPAKASYAPGFSPEPEWLKERSPYFGGDGEYAPEQMSVDAYLQLAPQQRAAVDANTALVSAAEQDIASWAKTQLAGTPVDDQDYYSQVNDAFGDKGGSDTYAPRTMAVLSDLGLDLKDKDLDQYLNYSALVTADDLAGIAPGAAQAPDNARQQNAVAFSEAASTRLSETLAAGQSLLDSLRSGSATGGELFGAPSAASPIGYANNERDAELATAFDVLSQTQSQSELTPENIGGLYTELQTKYNITPNEVAQYFETRLQANEYTNASSDQPISLGGPDSKLEYLTPADFRSKFLTRGE